MLRHDGAYYQSRVSFFNDTQRLDRTLGVPTTAPSSLEDALGMRMGLDDSRLCIACYTTGAVSGLQLHVQSMAPGLTCEACHGPGGEHIAAMKAGKLEKAFIFNPGRLTAGDLDDFCGSCHRSWWQVQEMHLRGVNNVRFQPYRLGNSRCWDAQDARIGCLACHDPHQHRYRDVAFYDSKCLSCHTNAGNRFDRARPGKPCPVRGQNCVTCHMPKSELPGGHFKFTDHEIRVVRPGAPYPD